MAWMVERGLVGASLLALLVGACGDARENGGAMPYEALPAPTKDAVDSANPGVPSPGSPALPGAPEPEPENGQTGSPGGAQCSPSDNVGDMNPACVQDGSFGTEPFGRAALVASACAHFNGPLPLCHCTLRVTRENPDVANGAAPEYELVALPGNRPDGCSEYARTPSCLYCENEFPGCDIDEPASCDAVCSDVAERYDADYQRTFSFTSRVARCKANTYCEWVTEIDGRCYARDPGTLDMPAFDCALSNAQILEHQDEMGSSECAPRAAATCASALDCPRGLACSAGRCVPCSGSCPGPDGNPASCGSDPRCADGEACVEGLCIPEANVTCSSFTDCGENQQCVLSGMDLSAGRGNGATRSFCAPSSAL